MQRPDRCPTKGLLAGLAVDGQQEMGCKQDPTTSNQEQLTMPKLCAPKKTVVYA